MKTLDFLVTLRDRDIQIRADGDRLRCNGPAGALTIELRRELRQRKDEILKFLHSAGTLAQQQRAIVPLQSHGTRAPIFAVAGHNGDVFCFRALAQHLGDNQPFFGLQPPGLDGNSEPLTRVEDLAAYFAAEIRAFQPIGPYIIAGYCAGGTIAFELARQLLRDDAEIGDIALFGSPFPTYYRFLPQLGQRLGQTAQSLIRHTRAIATLPVGKGPAYVAERFRNRRLTRAAERETAMDPVFISREKVGRATLAAIRNYTPDWFAGRLNLFWPGKYCSDDALFKWPSTVWNCKTFFGPDECDGSNMLREPFAAAFAEHFQQSVQGVQSVETAPSREPAIIPPLWGTGQTRAPSL